MYNHIIRAADFPDHVHAEISESCPSLDMLRQRYEGVPLEGPEEQAGVPGETRPNVWWIKTPETEDAYWVRFASARLNQSEGKIFLRLQGRPAGLYEKVPHEEEGVEEVFFKRV